MLHQRDRDERDPDEREHEAQPAEPRVRAHRPLRVLHEHQRGDAEREQRPRRQPKPPAPRAAHRDHRLAPLGGEGAEAGARRVERQPLGDEAARDPDEPRDHERREQRHEEDGEVAVLPRAPPTSDGVTAATPRRTMSVCPVAVSAARISGATAGRAAASASSASASGLRVGEALRGLLGEAPLHGCRSARRQVGPARREHRAARGELLREHRRVVAPVERQARR